MIRPRHFLTAFVALASLLLATSASAAPRVVVDIAPLHSLVAKVMAGAGDPTLLIRANVSPHHASLRPSDVRALDEAEVVFWMGRAFTPPIGRAIDATAGDALVVTILDLPQTRLLPARRSELFAEPMANDGEGRSIWALPAATNGGPAAHEGPSDPHAWLDPVNAQAWLPVIADGLAVADPDNAGLYRANAAEAVIDLEALTSHVEERLAPYRAVPFVVMHDAYRYFEVGFGMNALGAIAVSDAARPGPRRVAALSDAAAAAGVACVFTEPQTDTRLARVVGDASGARLGVLDPIGATLQQGPTLYDALIIGIADALVDCLGAARD